VVTQSDPSGGISTLVGVSARPHPSHFVVRGGLFGLAEDLLTAVEDSFEDGDGAVASVHVGAPRPGESFDAALRRVCIEGALRNGRVRVTTVAKLLAAGFDVVPDHSDDQPRCHHNVVFTEPPNIDQARLFVECFDAPIPNPAKEA
jgi:hypothetical protein